MRYAQKTQRGFTLIEMMITVAIIGILAAIIYPSYTSYVLRGYRSEGIAQLNDAVARMERYYAQNNTYATATTLATLGITNANSTNSRFTLSAPTVTATTYTLQTVAQGAQQKDTGCTTLSITQDGTRSPDPSSTTNCWK